MAFPLTTYRYFDTFRLVTTSQTSLLKATEEHVEAFKSLFHASRLEVFFFLVRSGREVSPSEIQAELDIPGPTLSHHYGHLAPRRSDQEPKK
jgi:hypothetical protein